MNIFSKLTLQSLKKNKTRTVVTVIGIMLSAAMICAVTTFTSSMRNYALEYTVYTQGDWHVRVTETDGKTLDKIEGESRVDQYTYNEIIGYAEIDSKNTYKPYIYLIGGEKESFFDMLPVHLINGRYPENKGEIIIPEHLLSNGGLSFKIGDTVALDIGDRMLDGYIMGQSNPCYTLVSGDEVLNDEKIEVRFTESYKIVGIYERPDFEEYTAPGYTAITVSSDNSADAKLDIFYKMKNPKDTFEFSNQMIYENSFLQVDENTDVLMFSGASRFSSFEEVLTGLAVIVIVLIMFGSVALIYNAFAISVSERTKQFGLLSSIGATKKQLRRMVLFEALAVSGIGIPLGIGVGIAGIAVTLLIIGDKFSSITEAYDLPMRVCVSWEAVAIAAAVGLITVLISAWIPSIRATKITAVEAIRQSADIKISKRQAKTSRITYMLFGLSGVIASKHYKRNKRKYRTTVISLFMSIVLFVSASAFTDYLMESVGGAFYGTEYDILYSIDADELSNITPLDVQDLLTTDENVTECAYIRRTSLNGDIDKKYVTDAPKFSQYHDYTVNGYIYFVADASFNEFADKHRLNTADYYDKSNPVAIAIDGGRQFDYEHERYISVRTLIGNKSEIGCEVIKYRAGYDYVGNFTDEQGNEFIRYRNLDANTDEIITVPKEEAMTRFTLRSNKTVVDDYPFYINKGTGASLVLLYPMSMAEYAVPADKIMGSDYEYYLKSDDHAASFGNIKRLLMNNNLDFSNISDIAADDEAERNTIIIIRVFAYGFIVLISMIAATNVFNTITTNINLRRREFAMLKSVGMSGKGFNKMMNFECVLYGSKALLLGLPVSAIVTYFIYFVISDGYETTYHLPWGAIGIAILSVFLVVGATMLYAMRKIKKDNPIDALKNENL